MKMRTSEITTAEVVDSPTPLAPPVVVKPQEQLTYGRVHRTGLYPESQALVATPQMHTAAPTIHVSCI